MYNKLFIDVLKNSKNDKIPIWLMRQAGRYLPEYRSIRGGVAKFLELCYNPKLASAITLQPIERFGFDAAILFSDILVVADSLGLAVSFESGSGPVLETVRDNQDIKKLKISQSNTQFQNVWETVSLVKANLNSKTTLIGFAGAPWTVATYILEGKGGKATDFKYSKKIAKNNPEFLTELINIIIEQTIYYLVGQIDAGAEVIQLFDSWAEVLDYDEYKSFVEVPTKKIVAEIRRQRPNIPIICFPKGITKTLEEYRANVLPDAISLGSNVTMEQAKSLQKSVVVQGNLDPMVLTGSKEGIKVNTENILDNLAGKGLIFNLGHGILPETPIENVEFLVDLVRNYEKNSGSTT